MLSPVQKKVLIGILLGTMLACTSAFAQETTTLDLTGVGTGAKTEVLAQITKLLPVIGALLGISLAVAFSFKLIKRSSK